MLANKKVKKLIRDPQLFFSDLVKNQKNKYLVKNVKGEVFRRYTIVVCIEQSSKVEYCEKFFQSLMKQELFLDIVILDLQKENNLENEILKKKYDKYLNILYNRVETIQKETILSSLSSYTDYITFLSIDDFIDKSFFINVDTFITRYNNIDIVNSSKYTYNDSRQKVDNNHTLKYQFLEDKKVKVENLNSLFLNSLNGLTVSLKLFSELHIESDINIITINQALYDFPALYIGFSSKTIYIERIFPNELKFVKEIHTYRNLFLDNLYTSSMHKKDEKELPLSIRNHIIYYVFEYIKQYLINQKIALGLDDREKEELIILFKKLIKFVPSQDINSFKTSGFSFKYRVAFLSFFKNEKPKFQILYVKSFDKEKNLIQMNYFSYKDITTEEFFIDDISVVPEFSKIRSYMLFDTLFLNERILHIKFNNVSSTLSAVIDSKNVRFSFNKKQYMDRVPIRLIVNYLSQKKKEINNLSSIFLKKLAISKRYKEQYKDAWVFLDKDTVADDNAEHLYRYVMKNHKEVNTFFLLHKDSSDWNRLEKEGFNLVAFGSLNHKILLMNAINVLSSHAAPFVVSYLPPRIYANYVNFKFVFLQHGVTKDNISKWMNSRNVDCFIATSDDEYNSIAGNYNTYKMTRKEVALTGFSRHDALLSLPVKEKNMIMIMPTWRLFLAGELTRESGERALNPDFYDSQFAKLWKSFLHSKKLFELSKKFNYEIVFFPHPNILPYLSWFDIPSFINIAQNNEKSIQVYFKEAKFMITDYSSVAFEMAFLNKPVLYYHFDHEEFFSGNHSYSKGYYDYTKDGFGPIAYDEENLLENVQNILENKGVIDEKYQRNIDKAFKYRDGKNSERIVKVVKNLHEQEHYNSDLLRQIREKIKICFFNKDYKVLEHELLKLEEVVIDEEFYSINIITKIQLLKLDEAEKLFQKYKRDTSKNLSKELDLFEKYKAIVDSIDETILEAIINDNKSLEDALSYLNIEKLYELEHWQALDIVLNFTNQDEVPQEKLSRYYYIFAQVKRKLGMYEKSLEKLFLIDLEEEKESNFNLTVVKLVIDNYIDLGKYDEGLEYIEMVIQESSTNKYNEYYLDIKIFLLFKLERYDEVRESIPELTIENFKDLSGINSPEKYIYLERLLDNTQKTSE